MYTDLKKKILLSMFRLKMSSRNKSGVRILLFHEITEEQEPKFKKLIQFIAQKYKIISPAEFDKSISLNSTSIIISFDDGFQSQVKMTHDILTPLGIKALFFICPAFHEINNETAYHFICEKMGRKEVFAFSESFLPASWGDLKLLSQEGHEIGCHTMNHSMLSTIKSEKLLKREIIEAGKTIGEKIGKKVSWFAYPFGRVRDIDLSSLSVIAKRYNYCFTGIRGVNSENTNPLCIWRQQIDLNNSLEYQELLLEGGLDIYYFFKRMQLKKLSRSL